jgi:hypothetical protein
MNPFPKIPKNGLIDALVVYHRIVLNMPVPQKNLYF